MKKTMKERYEDKYPIAMVSLCTGTGVAIYEPEGEDKKKEGCDFVAAWYNLGYYTGFHKHKIHTTDSGREYIRKGQLRFYLDEITRY